MNKQYFKFMMMFVCLIAVISTLTAFITIYPADTPHKDNGDTYNVSKLFGVPFNKLPVPLINYANAKDDIDLIILSTSMNVDDTNVIGLVEYKGDNIVLIDSGEIIIEIIANNEREVMAVYNLTPKLIDSKEIFETRQLAEKNKITVYDLNIIYANDSNSEILSTNIITVSYENWIDIAGCLGKKDMGIFMEGKYYIDYNGNVVVLGNSYIMNNCLLLSNAGVDTYSQNGIGAGALSSTFKWESKGFPITSKFERSSTIGVDYLMNINIWTTEDSWLGYGVSI